MATKKEYTLEDAKKEIESLKKEIEFMRKDLLSVMLRTRAYDKDIDTIYDYIINGSW